jgi:hypothetical protein
MIIILPELTNHSSVYNQLLYMPVRAGKPSISKEKNCPGHFIKAIVTRYRSALVHATDLNTDDGCKLKGGHYT